MHEWVCCHYDDVSHQLPIAVAFWTIWVVSTEECSSLMQNWMQIHCSTCLAILNVTATEYTCSFNGLYLPYWLVQWSCHYSRMRIPVHSPWLPGYIEVVQTILVILTMVGLFLDRPHVCDFNSLKLKSLSSPRSVVCRDFYILKYHFHFDCQRVHIKIINMFLFQLLFAMTPNAIYLI